MSYTDPGRPRARALVPLPAQPGGVPWPTGTWPRSALPDGVELGPLLEEAFDASGPLGQTYAMVAVQGGRLVFERYEGLLPQWDGPGKPVGEDTPLLSWSMAKSMLHAVAGMLVGDCRIGLHDPAPVPEWSGPGDPRGRITVEHLLEMRDGLDFNEDYEDAESSDVIQMLFGRGRSDMARFAADHPLGAVPGARFRYSSGTSNVLSGIAARLLGPGDGYRSFLADRLFGPLGMASATARFDDAGTWVASSYVYATARDFARFGLLYLRDGVWAGKRLLPEGWVDHGRTPRSVDPDEDLLYGAHWWVTDDGHGTFWAAGHEGQSIDVCPGLDLVLVRLGRTGSDRSPDLRRWRAAVIDRFAASAGT